MPDLHGMSKADIVRWAQELDNRRQAQISRQIDSINRLLAAEDIGPVPRYEHELMTLNEKLALADIEHERMTGALLRLHRKLSDKPSSARIGPRYIQQCLEIVLEGLPGVDSQVVSSTDVEVVDTASAENGDSSS